MDDFGKYSGMTCLEAGRGVEQNPLRHRSDAARLTPDAVRPWLLAIILAALLSAVSPATAQQFDAPVYPMSDMEKADPALPHILSPRARATVIDRILKERLDQVIPKIMRDNGASMWLMMAREYFEEPVIATMLDAGSMHARRRTILIFFDPGDGEPIERLTVSRYGLGDLFAPAWDPDKQPDQWQAVAEIIEQRDPKNIAINTSDLTAFGDGMTLSQYTSMTEALPGKYKNRIISGETLSVQWLETRTQTELGLYPGIVRIAHAIINEAFSPNVITPGKTTTDDVVWWYRQRLMDLGLHPWFHPSVALQRSGAKGMLKGDSVIQPGDLLWTDFGITYLRLNTDTQHLAYVLKPGETVAPDGLTRGLKVTNKVQDILISHFKTGASGNQILAQTRVDAISRGFNPSIYTHPIGSHGHGAGTKIGFWDNQNGDERGEYLIRPNTAWSIELTSFSPVPEWGDQIVDFRSEENAFFDGETVRFLDGRQTELTLIHATD